MTTASNQLDVHDYDTDLAPKEFRFKFQGKQYVLVDPSADAARRWRNANIAGSSMDKDTNRIIVSPTMADSETVLVQGCVYQLLENKSGEEYRRGVGLADVRAWPDALVSDLFNRAKDFGGLDKGDGEAKKLPPPAPSNGMGTSTEPEA